MAMHTPPPFAADIFGEDDWEYFGRRRDVCTRIRLPFENEYPCFVLLPGAPAYVRVQVERADGQLKRRRCLRFCNGGHA
jgi:hypothetical protein